MKLVDTWYFPDRENHLPEWMADPRNRVIMNGRPAYQGKKQAALLALCKNFRTAIDVGSHVGLWTYNLAPRFQTVRCFEPMDDHRACFVHNIAAENVVLYPLALGERSARVGMKTNESSTGDTYVQGDGAFRMETLDSFGFEDVDAIKIDVEGREEFVIEGARETLARCKPVMCVEQKRDFPVRYGLKPQGAVALLRELGYVVAQEIGGDYLMTPAEPH